MLRFKKASEPVNLTEELLLVVRVELPNPAAMPYWITAVSPKSAAYLYPAYGPIPKSFPSGFDVVEPLDKEKLVYIASAPIC